MKTIEGIKVTISFGHYESYKDQSYLVPDFTYDDEVTSSLENIADNLPKYKKEIVRLIGGSFANFINDYFKKKEIGRETHDKH